MVVQDIKRGHFKNVDGDGLHNLLEAHFDGPIIRTADGWLETSYVALPVMRVRVLGRDKLEVHTEADRGATPEVAAETIRRWNTFLQAATGFTAKERSKRLQKKAKDGGL
jgi:hypothetical protein